MSSDELSLEELSRLYARVMSGNSESVESSSPELNVGKMKEIATFPDDLVNIPDEFSGDDYTLEYMDGEQGDNNLAMFDESGVVESAVTTFRSYMDEIDDDKCVSVTPKTILEAMLFVGNPNNIPIAPEIFSNLMRGVSVCEIHELVEELNQEYKTSGCPWEIQWFEEEKGYFMQLREAYSPLRESFYGKIRQARLSQAAIDILALVAYEQPITADEINQLRNTPSNSILAQLVRRQLIRTQKIRRGTKFVTVYFTTERFLKLFELESISDLPQSEDLDRE